MIKIVTIFMFLFASNEALCQTSQWQAVPATQVKSFQNAINENVTAKQINCTIVQGGTIYGENGETTVIGILVNFIRSSPAVFKNQSGSQPMLMFVKEDVDPRSEYADGQWTQVTRRRDIQLTTTIDKKSVVSAKITKNEITTKTSLVNVGDLAEPNYQLRTVVTNKIDQALCTLK